MFELFAQAGKADDPFKGMEGAPVALIIGIFCGIVLVALIVTIFFLLTMSKALKRCRPRCRSMEPGMVWLMLVPLFNIVWQFFVVNRVTESIGREYRKRGWSKSGDFGQSVGMAMCILSLTTWIPFLGYLTALAHFVCFIMFWVKIAGYSGELARTDDEDDEVEDDVDDRRRNDDEEEEEEEEDDDRPRRRK